MRARRPWLDGTMTDPRATLRRPADRRRPAARTATLVALSALCVLVALVAVTPYLTGSLESLAADDAGLARNYVDRPTAVRAAFFVHLVAGGAALLLSPWQLWPGLRRRHPGLHRATGRTVVVAIGFAGVSGLVIAPVNEAGLVGVLGFGSLAVLWLAAAGLGWRAIRRGDVPAHRAWMIRAFALTFAGVTLRVWLGVLVGAQSLWPGSDADPAAMFDRAYAVVPFLSWVPNLVVAERVVRRGRLRADGGPRPAAPPTAPAA